MMNYKRVIIEKFGSPEVLSLVEEPNLPEPKDNEVKVKVLYTNANFTDIMIRKGMYPEVKEKPRGHYPLEKVQEVHRLIEEASIKGKIVFDPWQHNQL